MGCQPDVTCEDRATCSPLVGADGSDTPPLASDAAQDAVALDVSNRRGDAQRTSSEMVADAQVDTSATRGEAGRDASAEGAEAAFDGRADVQEEEATPPCDATKTPSEDGCVIDAKYGVFVSPLGSDATGIGTEMAPYKTLTRALTVAQGRRVYACATAGTFDEKVTIAAGATVFGGFDCTGSEWSYLNTRSALVRPSTPGIALTMSGAQRIEIENVAFEARDAADAGGSSVAAWANGAATVVLRRVTLVAGNGKAGAEVTTTPNYTALAAPDGASTMTAVGAIEQMCLQLCANGVHATGGRGGDGAVIAPAGGGEDGTPAIAPASPPGATGTGGEGKAADNVSCSLGAPGSNALSAAGGAGAAKWGALSASGWTSSTASAGGTGGPGQGGGGGGGGVVPGGLRGGGGGGACGGCGGAGGRAGLSGGSSFALLSYLSGITVDGCVLTAGSAGAGSKGADGQVGQAGGFAGVAAVAGCPGGPGGLGGSGGGGGGGAAGLSAAVGYAGVIPSLNAATTTRVAATPALGGAAGLGGAPPASKGRDGVAIAVLDLSL